MNDEEAQLARFKAAARELETDDDQDRFNAKLKKLAKKPLTAESDSESMAKSGGDG